MGGGFIERHQRLQVEFMKKLLATFPDGEWTTEEAIEKLGLSRFFVQKKMQNLQVAQAITRDGKTGKWKVKS